MADIAVTLGLDDSAYTSKLKAAETQAKSFSSTTTNAFSGIAGSVNATSQAVGNLNDKFDKLSSALVGAGIVAFANSLLSSANALKDMADGLDVNISRMMEMGVAASQAGGNLEKVAAMMSKLELSTAGAINGNAELRVAFDRLGTSIGEVAAMSPDERFNKVAESLAGITNPTLRAAAASELLGKTYRGFNFEEYTKKIKDYYGTMDQYGESTRRAADVSEQMAMKLTLVKAAFTDLLKPVFDLIPATGDMAESMKNAERVALLLGLGLGAIVAGQVITGITALTGVFSALTTAMGFAAGGAVVEAAATGVLTKETLTLMAVKKADLTARAELLAAKIAEARMTLATITTIHDEAVATVELASAKRVLTITLGQYNAAAAAAAGATAALSTAEAAAAGTASAMIPPTVAATTVLGTLRASLLSFLATPLGLAIAVVAALEGINVAGEKLAKTFGVGSQGPLDGFATILESFIKDKFPALHAAIEKTGDLLGMGKSDLRKANEGGVKAIDQTSPEAIAKAKALADEIQRRKDAQEAADKALKEGTEKMIAQYTAQANAIKATTAASELANQKAMERVKIQIATATASKQDQELTLAAFDAAVKYEAEVAKVDLQIAELKLKRGSGKTAEVFNKEGGAQVLAALEAQKKALEGLRDTAIQAKDAELQRAGAIQMQNDLLSAQQKAKDILFDLTKETAQMEMTTNQKRLSDVQFMIEKEQRAAVKAFEDARGRKATAQEAADINKKIAQSYDGIYDKTAKVIAQSRDFSTGWGRAMKQYVEDAGNAAKTAESLFSKATQGMEDAIVNFAKTGKFEWKSFVASMLEELLRSQIKQLFANMMSSMSGSLGGLAAAFGTAGVNNQTAGNTGGGGSSGGGILDAIGSIFGGGSSAKGTPVFVTNMPGGTGFGGAGGSATGSSLLDMFNGVSKVFPNSPAFGQTPGIFSGGTDGSNGLLDTVNGLFGGGASYPNSPAISVPSTASGGGIGGGGGIFSGIADTFSSIGDSISSMFDGWFADGGTIGAGKFGVVGERGPELVRGPGTVSPMGDGSGSGVVNNYYATIYANDALSFKQQLAADPQFIWAVTQQGAKGMRA